MGGVSSPTSTVIVCTQLLWFPQSSVAVQVRVITFSPQQADASLSLEVIVTEISQLSVAVALLCVATLVSRQRITT